MTKLTKGGPVPERPELPDRADGSSQPPAGICRRATPWPALLLILALSAAMRLYGLEWDAGHWLHPDERQIYFVALDLGWPASLAEALSPESPLNPGFFAYGSLPIYLLRAAAALLTPLWPALRDPGNLHLAGRLLAVLFDLGTIYLTYRLARILSSLGGGDSPERSPSQLWPVVAAGLVGTSVLHVQSAHFYTVDVLLTFFATLALTLAADVALGAGAAPQAGLGVVLGLALATKISATPLLLVVPAAFYIRSARSNASWKTTLPRIALSLALAVITFLLVQPYALLDWRTFVTDNLRESQIAWGRLEVPYTLQYAGTVPYLYPAWQTALWALALPVGLAGWAGLAYLLVRWLRRGTWADSLLLPWAGPYFAITGLLYAKPLRYMLPLVPVLCLASTQWLARVVPWMGQHLGGRGTARQNGARRAAVLGGGAMLACGLIYVLAFARIYAQPHPWVEASEWIYEHVPPASTLAVEHWDTALPLSLDLEGRARRIEEYDLRLLKLYDEPDDATKWSALAQYLAESDYLVLASRRVYGAVAALPQRYFTTARYYEQLFSGQLGFELEAEFVRGPAWLNPRVPALPGAGPAWLRPDESFVVYDHPRALIFRNVARLPAEELLRRLGVGMPVGAAHAAPSF
jgi:4-amino-4-deoxy-L-arabinose transferase-like glycosyltransferase